MTVLYKWMIQDLISKQYRVLGIATALLNNLHQQIVGMHSHMFLHCKYNFMSDWFWKRGRGTLGNLLQPHTSLQP